MGGSRSPRQGDTGYDRGGHHDRGTGRQHGPAGPDTPGGRFGTGAAGGSPAAAGSGTPSCGRRVRRGGVRGFPGRVRGFPAACWACLAGCGASPAAWLSVRAWRGRFLRGAGTAAAADRRPQAERGTQFLGEPAAARVTVGRVLRQRGGEHRVDRRGYSGAPCASGRRVRVDLRVHQGLALVGTERRRAAQELEPGARQRILVGPPVEVTALDLLGREVVEDPGGLVRRDDLPGREGLAHPEIGEVRAADRGPVPRVVAIEEDVGGPDVTVDQAVRVRGI